MGELRVRGIDTALVRRARAAAALEGESLRDLVARAVLAECDALGAPYTSEPKPKPKPKREKPEK